MNYYAAMSSSNTVTDEQIENLRDEARSSGDSEQVSVCDAALAGDAAARAECSDVIAYAAARAEELS